MARFLISILLAVGTTLVGACSSTDQNKTFSGTGVAMTGLTIARDNLALSSGNPNAPAIMAISADIRAGIIQQDALWLDGKAQLAEAEASAEEGGDE